jgi:hypothetical protein
MSPVSFGVMMTKAARVFDALGQFGYMVMHNLKKFTDRYWIR